MIQLSKLISILFLLFYSSNTNFYEKLARAAEELTQDKVTYNGQYFSIDYPMGDVPAQYGVCTDVVVRAYRKVGIDLQQLVHEDMKSHFNKYPQLWGLSKTDTNIDHRRVPNLRRFFERKGQSLSTSEDAKIYQPGDVISWVLPNNLTHIGIVSNSLNRSGDRYLMVHNIGSGQVLEDCLFAYKITGHYRYGE